MSTGFGTYILIEDYQYDEEEEAAVKAMEKRGAENYPKIQALIVPISESVPIEQIEEV